MSEDKLKELGLSARARKEAIENEMSKVWRELDRTSENGLCYDCKLDAMLKEKKNGSARA